MRSKLSTLRSALTALAAAALTFASCSQAYMPDLDAAWQLNMESMDSSRTFVKIHSSDVGAPTSVSYNGKTTEVFYEKIGGKDINLTFTYLKSSNALEITSRIENNEKGYVALSLSGPFVDSLDVDVRNMDLLVPNGPGVRYNMEKAKADKFWKKDKRGSLVSTWNYPTEGCNMQWLELTGCGENLYLASHDPEFRWKKFIIHYYPDTGKTSFALQNQFTCFPGESYTCPTTLIEHKKGDWKEGAKTYREWFRSVKNLPEKPEWITRASGWLLAILKQQNDEIFWTYPEVGNELLDIADERGIDIIGLFGWTVGGHDRFYPEYTPCPRMGGEAALKEAIQKIHARGKKAVIYFNGQLIDQDGTKFWPDTGRFITSVRPDGSYYAEKWWKYADIPPRIHGVACLHSTVWRDKLLSLAKQAYELGADGVLYDQLANNRTPEYCYGEGHGHQVPVIGREKSAVRLLDYLSAQMKKVDPEFLIMVEGVVDCQISGVSMFHGNSRVNRACNADVETIRSAYAASDREFYSVFPDLFHYTLPEADFTVRCPTPASTHESLNFSTLFGYKHEIETRYQPDKRYLIENRIPPQSEYEIVRGSKPKYSTLSDQDPLEVIAYSKAVLDFRKEYADILYDGDFSSDDGFALASQSRDVIARSFINGNRMGVVVWNMSSDSPATFDVTPEAGWTFRQAVAPAGTPSEGPIPAESIRMLIFER